MTLHIGGYSVVFGALALIVITAYFAFLVVNTWAIVRILRRVGYSGWWGRWLASFLF